MPDYSEFPTTPTAWQEAQLRDWQTITPLSTEDPEPAPSRGLDRMALVPGVFFAFLAITLLIGINFLESLFVGGGILWLVLIVAGAALLVSELRKVRRGR
jgi:hypothetical protein